MAMYVPKFHQRNFDISNPSNNVHIFARGHCRTRAVNSHTRKI